MGNVSSIIVYISASILFFFNLQAKYNFEHFCTVCNHYATNIFVNSRRRSCCKVRLDVAEWAAQQEPHSQSEAESEPELEPVSDLSWRGSGRRAV